MKAIIFLALLHLQLCASFIYNVSIATESNSTFTPTSLPIKFNDNHNYWVKVDINQSLISEQNTYLLELETLFGRDNISFNNNYLTDTLNKNAIFLNDTNQSSYLFKVVSVDNLIFFDAKVTEKTAYYKTQQIKQNLYGVSYGVMLSAILYYLFFYIFNRKRTYIFYSITQFFMLIMLIIITFKSSNSNDYMLFGMVFTFFIIFTSLFTSSFLHLNKYAPIYNHLIIASSFILIIEAYTSLFSKLQIPTSELMLIYILIAIIVYTKTKFTYILFYLAGWGVLIVSLLFIELQILFFESNIISADALLHIAMPLESLMLALALSYKMKMDEEQRRQKEQLLIHYDKRASIGDMIDNIAHQWRQPLTHIGYLIMNVSAAMENNKLTPSLWKKKQQEMNLQLEYMSKSIDDFRDFYKPSLNKEYFDVEQCAKASYEIIKITLQLHEIELTICTNATLTLYGNSSELSQVLLNLIINSKEAFEKNNIKKRKITITISENDLSLEDNAGGIDPTIQKKLFKLHNSTKDNGGHGLYMSNLIIEEHFHSNILHTNIHNGSKFSIHFPKTMN